MIRLEDFIKNLPLITYSSNFNFSQTNKYTKHLCLVLCLILFNLSFLKAQTTYTSKKSGNFNNTATWGETYAPGSNEYNNGDSRVPSIDKYIISTGHTVDLNIDFELGKQGNTINKRREIIIEKGATLRGNGRLILYNNGSSIINNGIIELTSVVFGRDLSDSVVFKNNGTAILTSAETIKNTSLINNGSLTLNNNGQTIVKSLIKNLGGKTITFLNQMHVNEGSTIRNFGFFNLTSTNDEALNLNNGAITNCGKMNVAGGFNVASGISETNPNQLLNYGTFSTSKVYLNSKTSIKNWGKLYCTNDFTSTQGKITNYPCAYIEQSSKNKTFANINSGSVIMNDGYIKIVGNFLNKSHAILDGSGTVHIEGRSENSDQAKIEGSLYIYDTDAKENILDYPILRGATIASTIKGHSAPQELSSCYMSCTTSDDCIDYGYSYYKKDNNTYILSFTVKVNCNKALSHIAFQIPEGVSIVGNPKLNNSRWNNMVYGQNPHGSTSYNSAKFDGLDVLNEKDLKDGATLNFSFELTQEQFNKLARFEVEAKAGTEIKRVKFDGSGCEAINVPGTSDSWRGPKIMCNISQAEFSIVKPKEGVTYNYILSEGLFLSEDNGNGTITVLAFMEEDQLKNNPKQTITVITTENGISMTTVLNVEVFDCDVEGTPLPVELIKFEGSARQNKVDLSWTTATEKNNDRFEVERSTNGRDFVKIGQVQGNGTSLVTLQYAFTDVQPSAGVSYYRLKQVDYDGAYEYSKLITVEVKASAFEKTLAIQNSYPNPFQSNLVVDFSLPINGTVTFTVYDLAGKVVSTKQVAGLAGINQTNIEGLDKLLRGMYILKLAANNQSTSIRVLKVN